MDVKRLKVTELRAELGRRGLDSRGLKLDLVQRLQEALDAEMLAAGPEEAGAEAGAAAGGGQSLTRARLGVEGDDDDDEEEEEEEEEEDEEEDEEEEDEEALLADEEEQPQPPPQQQQQQPPQAEATAGGEQAPSEPGDEGRAQQPGGVNGAQPAAETGEEAEASVSAEASAGGEAEEGGDQEANEDEKAKQAGPDADRHGLKRQRDEKEEHGRAYFEFREEAYNSRSKSPPPPEEEARAEDDETLVTLDTYTCDLHFKATKDGYGGQPLFSEKFPNLWSGARSTHGVKGGKVCFEAKVAQNLQLKEGCTETQLLRVGWSVDLSRSQLGEDEFSYGYDGRGLKAENGQFEEFGQAFGENDVIGCFANFESEEVELSFSKNGEDLGVAFQISKELLGDRALLPHILCKNCAVELNFGQKEEPFFPVPEDYLFIHAIPVEERVRTPLPPKAPAKCETKGPAVEDPLPIEARDSLLQQAARCVSKLVQIAPRTRRNFILDQCNVYNSGQRRKLLPFKGFLRKVVVLVPSEENWADRLQQREKAEGENVPESVMLEMKANFSLPDKCDYIDEVLFQELAKEEAQPLVTKYKEEARKLLPPSEKRTNRRNNRNKRNRQNRNRGQGYGEAGGGRDRLADASETPHRFHLGS
ncbi:hypothetical protein Chor_005169 [Crotalus horridus]